MDDQLLGYLLDAQEPDERRRTEALLTADPAAVTRLERLRQAIAPLECDRDTIDPPEGLVGRTLAGVAEYLCQPGVAAPFPRPEAAAAGPRHSDPELALPGVIRAIAGSPPARGRSAARPLPPDAASGGPALWRRWDVAVAAALLLLVGGLSWPAVGYLRAQGDIVQCRDNLRRFHGAFASYADGHGGGLPAVSDLPPYNTAGAYVPLLAQAGVLPGDVNLQCPVHGSQPASASPVAPAAAYAFSLGYRDGARQLCGMRRAGPEPDSDLMPILADVPPGTRAGEGAPALARPHPAGQNVLFLGGHVQFSRTPYVGIDGDNIYLNREGKVRAGTDRTDAVLGACRESP